MGEFGRTPKINGNRGRDHWANSWTTVLAGGGIKGGQVVGKTSDDGMEVDRAARRRRGLPGHRRPGPGHRHHEAEHVQRRPAHPHRRADRQADQGGARMKTRILSPAVAGLAALLLACVSPAAARRGRRRPKPPADDVQDFVFLGEARPVLVRLHVRIDGKPLQAAWDDFMKYLFDYLDVDGDGVLSKDEAERAPTAGRRFGGSIGGGSAAAAAAVGAARRAPTMEDLDTDKDGKVTCAELAAYYRKNGFVPFQLQLDAARSEPARRGCGLPRRPRPSRRSRPSARRSSTCSTPTRTAS